VTVHQGGAGTLHTALGAGQPMLIVPFAHDQGDNAVRSVRLGVARLLFPSRYRREAVADHLGALSSTAMRNRAATVGEAIRSEQGALRACQALEALANGRAPHAGSGSQSVSNPSVRSGV
jgi:rhamnosyltransferase subunit B